jgi:hypothetical protein
LLRLSLSAAVVVVHVFQLADMREKSGVNGLVRVDSTQIEFSCYYFSCVKVGV